MASAIYILCILTSLACAWLLTQRYRKCGHRVLFWSALCFGGLTLNNLILVCDKLLFPEIDLLPLRQGSALLAVSLLVYGLIYEKE